MATSKNQYCYYRPNRQFPRRFGAADAGRIVRYAKEAGNSDESICLSIAANGGLECGECDCTKLKALVSLALGVVALAIAIRVRNKQALKQAQQAIAKAQESSRGVLGKIEVLEMESLLFLIDDGEDSIENYLDKLNEELLDAMANSFKATVDEAGNVIIREPKE